MEDQRKNRVVSIKNQRCRIRPSHPDSVPLTAAGVWGVRFATREPAHACHEEATERLGLSPSHSLPTTNVLSIYIQRTSLCRAASHQTAGREVHASTIDLSCLRQPGRESLLA